MTSPQRNWLLASLAWIGLIFFSSTSAAGRLSERIYRVLFGDGSQSGAGFLHFIAEKSVHVTLFFVLGLLLIHMYDGSRPQRFWKAAVTGLIIGSLSEYLQSFFPDRDPAIRDVLINFVSASIGAAIASVGRSDPSGTVK